MRSFFANLSIVLAVIVLGNDLALIGLENHLTTQFFETPWGRLSHAVLFFGTPATWVLTVLVFARVILNRVRPSSFAGFLSVTAVLATGLTGVFLGSVVLFAALFALTLAALVLGLREAGFGTPYNRTFCRWFAICLCLGFACVLMARGPVTGTPIIRIMWWAGTEWGQRTGMDWCSIPRDKLSLAYMAICFHWRLDSDSRSKQRGRSGLPRSCILSKDLQRTYETAPFRSLAAGAACQVDEAFQRPAAAAVQFAGRQHVACGSRGR